VAGVRDRVFGGRGVRLLWAVTSLCVRRVEGAFELWRATATFLAGMGDGAVGAAVWFVFKGVSAAAGFLAMGTILGACASYVMTCVVRRAIEQGKRQLVERTLSRVTEEASDTED
jgi:hypothetical protein